MISYCLFGCLFFKTIFQIQISNILSFSTTSYRHNDGLMRSVFRMTILSEKKGFEWAK